MKLITKNLLRFSLGLVLLTIIFRFSLSCMLQYGLGYWAFIVGFVYGILVFALGWVCGKKDKLHLPLYDIGFRFHLATYIICNLIAALWFLFGFQSNLESMDNLVHTVIYWGIGLLIHFILYLYTRKYAINGIKRSRIFD